MSDVESKPKRTATSATVASEHYAALRESWEVPSFIVKGDDFYKRFAIPLKTKEGNPTRVFGTVAIRKEGPTGPTFIFRRISSAQEAETLQATEEWKTTKLRESYGDFFDAGMDLGNAGNPTAPGSPNNEFVPILGGPFNKQLYLTDYLQLILSRELPASHDTPLLSPQRYPITVSDARGSPQEDGTEVKAPQSYSTI